MLDDLIYVQFMKAFMWIVSLKVQLLTGSLFLPEAIRFFWLLLERHLYPVSLTLNCHLKKPDHLKYVQIEQSLKNRWGCFKQLLDMITYFALNAMYYMLHKATAETVISSFCCFLINSIQLCSLCKFICIFHVKKPQKRDFGSYDCPTVD